MSHRLRIRPAADADVDGIAAYIARDNLDAALRFYDAVDSTFRELQDHPNRWPRYHVGHSRLPVLRKRSVKGFTNYLVFYQVVDKHVEVIRVLHGARDVPSALNES